MASASRHPAFGIQFVPEHVLYPMAAMTRTGRLTRRERRLLTRERVLSAALEVFEEHGYAQSSVEEIADRAGFTRKAVYSNFSGKAELLLEIVERRFQAHIDRVEDALGEGAAAEQAAGLATAFSGLFGRERAWEQLFHEFCAIAARDEEIGARFRGQLREAKAAITRLIEGEMRRQGLELTMPADRLVAGLFALFSGISLEKLVDPAATDDALFGEILALIGAGALRGAP